MSRTRVSVLLPLRDAAATLEPCLDSLAGQSLSHFEVVAVDHGSQDATPALLRRWADRLDLHVVRHETGSLLDALNAGLARCQGTYVARMDGDDLCLPQRLEAQAQYLDQHPECGLVGSRVELFSGTQALSEGYQAYQDWVNGLLTPEQIHRELFVECPLPHPTWMVLREVYERLGGYQDNDLPEDYHFLLRCAAAGMALAKHPEPLLRWREHPQRHSRTHPRYKREAFFKLKARFLPQLVLHGRPAIVWGAGDRGRLLIRSLLDEGAEVAYCVGIDEGQGLKATEAHGVPVVLPEALPQHLPGPILVCVGTPGVRASIYEWMGKRGHVEGKDWVFVS
jgi:cellulose synthase/poly-beta-1,6-N-acetylglucosamine synthase-like glycosyltransferase